MLRKPSSANLYTVKQEDLVDTIQVSGTYGIAAETPVTSPSNGIISKLYVQNGDVVPKGAWLFYVQSTATPEQQAAAYATYQVAASGYQEALNNRRDTQASVDNVHDEVKNNSGDETFAEKAQRTTAEVANDNAWDALKTANANLVAAQSAYDETQSSYAVAPASGQVVNLQKLVGDAVNTDTVLVIADFNNPRVVVPVNEVNVLRISPGQKATIDFDALPGQEFTGTVTTIDSVGTETQGEITYNVSLNLDNPPANIKPDMTANVTIETLRKDNVLTVPNSAIIKKNGTNYVNNENGNSIQIQLGAVGLIKSEVSSGLTVGQKITIPQ